MSALKPFCAPLLFLVILLTGSLAEAQDSETIAVTGLYSDNSAPPGYSEYEEILTPCDSLEVWDVAPTGPAFTALAQAYASAETRGQLDKYGHLFVEVRGRYTAYTGESHSDGIFAVTELARHSTAAADIKACGSECQDIYGANAPTCLAQEDGECGSKRDSCVDDVAFDDDVSLGTTDTATHYRWMCLGLYGGDSILCTAPKPMLEEGAAPQVSARSLLDLNWAAAPPAAIQALLDQGAEATARDRAGTTPLHFAAGHNTHPAVAALLLDQGADLQARTRGDCLHFLVDGLLSHNRQARLRERDGLVDHGGTTPLHCAAGANRNPAVVALLDRGADLTVSNKHGTTPLHFAAAANAHPVVAALLLDRGAVINARDELGHTPLHLAVRHNAVPVVALLLDRGAAVDARNDFGHTPLHSVTVRAAVPPAVVALLLDRGAAVNARDAILGETPLHYVAGRSTAIPAVAALLLDRGAAVDARNSFGQTPLHLAALYNGTPALVALLDRGADATLRDNAGKLPIDYVRGNAALKGTDISQRLNDPRF